MRSLQSEDGVDLRRNKAREETESLQQGIGVKES